MTAQNSDTQQLSDADKVDLRARYGRMRAVMAALYDLSRDFVAKPSAPNLLREKFNQVEVKAVQTARSLAETRVYQQRIAEELLYNLDICRPRGSAKDEMERLFATCKQRGFLNLNQEAVMTLVYARFQTSLGNAEAAVRHLAPLGSRVASQAHRATAWTEVHKQNLSAIDRELEKARR